jgi:hypothetical protein
LKKLILPVLELVSKLLAPSTEKQALEGPFNGSDLAEATEGPFSKCCGPDEIFNASTNACQNGPFSWDDLVILPLFYHF